MEIKKIESTPKANKWFVLKLGEPIFKSKGYKTKTEAIREAEKIVKAEGKSCDVFKFASLWSVEKKR